MDIMKVVATRVIEHLRRFSMEAKQPEVLEGSTALGLRLERDRDGGLNFSRGREVPQIPERMSKRDPISVCGKLVGHYPVAGWLRVASSLVTQRDRGGLTM